MHINSASSARMADIVGAIEVQKRHQGRWNNTMMNAAHLTSPSREMNTYDMWYTIQPLA
jgi:hypothetical protein